MEQESSDLQASGQQVSNEEEVTEQEQFIRQCRDFITEYARAHDEEPDFVRGFHRIGLAMLEEAEKEKNADRYSQVIVILGMASESMAKDVVDSRRGEILGTLAFTFGARYAISSLESDYEEATKFIQDTLDEPGFERPRALNTLGGLSISRFRALGTEDDLDKAIQYFRDALQLCENEIRPIAVGNVCGTLESRFDLKGDIADLDESVSLRRRFYDQCEVASAERLDTAKSLIQSLCRCLGKADLSADTGDLIKEVRRLHDEIDEPSYAPATLAKLASALDDSPDIDNLDGAVRLYELALELSDQDDPKKPTYMRDLGATLKTRFSRSGNLEDIQRSIVVQRQYVDAVAARGADQARALIQLALAFRTRYEHIGSLNDLQEMITLNRQALALFEDDNDTWRATCMNNLADMIHIRFERLGSIDDLEEALVLHKEVYDIRRASMHEDLHISMHNLSSILIARFQQYGRMEDLDESIHIAREALQIRVKGHPKRLNTLNNLANLLILRVEQSDITMKSDLDEAVESQLEVIELCPPAHPDLSGFLNTLGTILLSRFMKLGNLSNLTQAITYHYRALDLRPPGHFKRTLTQNQLSNALSIRGQLNDSLDDIGESIRLDEEVLETRVFGHPDRHLTLRSLGTAHMCRFKLIHDRADVTRALDLYKEALDLPGTARTYQAEALFNFAYAHILSGEPENIRSAIQYFFDAISDEDSGTQLRVKGALRLLRELEAIEDIFDQKTRSLVLTGYLMTMRLIPRAAYFGLDIRSRLDVLQQAEGVALRAAKHALALDRLEDAVEVLEEGRTMFWTQALRLRTQFDQVPAHLREKLVKLSHQLELDSYDPSSGTALGSQIAVEQDRTRRRRGSEEFEALANEVRQLPGLERFMLNNPFASLVAAAEKGPVVILVSNHSFSDALLIRSSGNITRVPLSGVTLNVLTEWTESLRDANQNSRDYMTDESDERAMKKIRPWASSSVEVLALLWDHVVKPVMDELGLKPSLGAARPRLWWCPTGPFAFLPIHGAGVYSTEGSSCADYIVSSYTPTLSALLNARRASPRMSPDEVKLLLAAVPRSNMQCRALPLTVNEVAAVKAIVPPSTLIPLPPGEDPTLDPKLGPSVQTMLDKLPQATILHLASHGMQNATSALDSGFIMQDGVLTISKIMPLPLPRAFLAFLSACETAKGDRAHPDQAVHLAATMLFAGFKSVVATMWSMSDVDGPVVAKRVYQELFKNGSATLDPDAIPYALDDVVRSLRDAGLPPSRWAPYIHIGV